MIHQTKGPRRARAGSDRAAIEDALDTLALIIEQSGNRKLLPIFEHLENELAALDDGDEVLLRALKRSKRKRRATV